MQELVWLVNNDANTVKSQEMPLTERVPFMEFDDPDLGGITSSILKTKAPPRYIKTHLPARMFQKALDDNQIKIIYVMRNPKDTLVSFYHFYKMNAMLGKFKDPFSKFLEMFYNKELTFGDWFDHVLGYWRLRDRPNVLFVKYEDMKKDPFQAVKAVANFCNASITDEQCQIVANHTSFDAMKKNPATNYQHWEKKGLFDSAQTNYMRKGTPGDWKNYFTVAEDEKFNEYFNSKMEGTGLHVDF